MSGSNLGKGVRPKDIEFGGPATYRIVVQGVLDESWSDRLAGLAISVTTPNGAMPHTTLFGLIRDQAELSGVLDTLHSLHLPILRVETVDDES
jgi:hypothetical protein